MRFEIKFCNNNLIKFRHFIKTCNKIFNKSGIIMTIIKDNRITVVPDPFNISDPFKVDSCSAETLKLYHNYFFLEYFLIPKTENSQKNSTFLSMTYNSTKSEDNKYVNLSKGETAFTFRISRDELTKLNELLQTNFQTSNELTILATKIPEFIKKKIEGLNYKIFLSLYDKQKNATKCGILFKPLKRPYEITDYEEIMEGSENKYLGKFLYNNSIKTKIIKKLAAHANRSFTKAIYLYFYKENDMKEKNIKSYFFLTSYPHYISFGNYIQEEENEEEFKIIHKIGINSLLLTRMLKNFNSDANNPDFMSVWTKGLVVKTNFTLKSNFEEGEGNNENNFFDNDVQNPQNENEDEGEDRSYMQIKSFMFFEKEDEILNFEKIDINDGIAKKKYVLNLIENNVEDTHDELNKSLELTDIDGVVYRGNNSLMDEDGEDIDDENNDDKSNDNNDNSEDEIAEKKGKGKKRKKEINQENDEEDDKNVSIENIDDNDDESNADDKKKYKKNKKQKKHK